MNKKIAGFASLFVLATGLLSFDFASSAKAGPVGGPGKPDVTPGAPGAKPDVAPGGAPGDDGEAEDPEILPPGGYRGHDDFRQPGPGDKDRNPDGRSIGTRTNHGPKGGAKTGGPKPSPNNGITYHGGPLMNGTPTVYFIWYGNWAGNTAQTLLPQLITGLGGSPYFNINTTYTSGASAITGQLAFGGSAADSYSLGTALTDANIQSIVSAAITAKKVPMDTNALYFVLTSADVNETSGFCTQYCGWHDHASIGGSDVKYGFIGNPDRCPSSCAAQTTSPNGNAGADGMASIIAHETEEAVTDPDLNAWYDNRGYENADKCAWTFGTTSKATNGSKYNVTLGGLKWLIQQNWLNAGGGKCTMHYP
jgi:hypothetical protein